MKKEVCKYESEVNITLDEFMKMYKAFPINFWYSLLYPILVISLLVCIICIVDKVGFGIYAIIEFFSMILLVVCYKLNYNKKIERYYYQQKENGNLKCNYSLKFYDEYLIKENELIKEKIYYSSILKIVETNENFYLRYLNKIIVIVKEKEQLELYEFLRNLDLNNYAYKKIKTNNKVNVKNEKILWIIFIITLLSLNFAMISHSFLCEYLKIPLELDNKYMWIFYLWLPVPFISIYWGIKYKDLKNTIIGIIISLFLIIYGSFWTFPTYEVSYNEINKYKNVLNINLPSDGMMFSHSYDLYFNSNMKNVSYNKVYFEGDEENFNDFEKQISTNQYWSLKEDILTMFDLFKPLSPDEKNDKYYLFYNETLDEYNTLLNESGLYHMIIFSYSFEDKMMEIIDCDFAYIE